MKHNGAPATWQGAIHGHQVASVRVARQQLAAVGKEVSDPRLIQQLVAEYGGVVLEARGYSHPELLEHVQHAAVVVVQALEALGYRI